VDLVASSFALEEAVEEVKELRRVVSTILCVFKDSEGFVAEMPLMT
jgi:hypothetical protein